MKRRKIFKISMLEKITQAQMYKILLNQGFDLNKEVQTEFDYYRGIVTYYQNIEV